MAFPIPRQLCRRGERERPRGTACVAWGPTCGGSHILVDTNAIEKEGTKGGEWELDEEEGEGEGSRLVAERRTIKVGEEGERGAAAQRLTTSSSSSCERGSAGRPPGTPCFGEP